MTETLNTIPAGTEANPFADRLLGVLNDAGLALMISIGHRTELFDVMSKLAPSTSVQIAAAAGLDERYVREWLGAMATGRIVDHDPEGGTYRLPPDHAEFLTRAAKPNNVAATMQFFSILGGVEDAIVNCFRHGGGVPYAAYGRFQRVMAEESDQTTCHALLENILPLEPSLADRLREGIDVADIGCGSGRAINVLAKTFPNSRFVGYDISEEGIAAGRVESRSLGLANARFEVRDVARLDEVDRFGLITAFDAIHDQAKPAQVLANIARALREDGVFLMQDIAGSSHVHENLEHPMAPFIYTISCMHCMTVSLAQRGDGLGAMWGRQKAEQMLGDAGFNTVTIQTLPHDIMNCYYVARRNGHGRTAAG